MAARRFVGRHQQVSDIVRRLASTDPEGSLAVVVEAAPGMGKSSLLDEVVRHLESSIRPISASPVVVERDVSWGTIRLLLDDGLAVAAKEAGIDVPDSVLEAAGLGPGIRTTHDLTEVAYAFAQMTAAISAVTDPVFVLDDLQWVDPASATALSFALRSANGSRWLLAARAGEPLGLEPARVATTCTSVELPPMIHSELAELAFVERGHPLTRAEIQRLQQLSQGNPLHARELVGTGLGSADAALPGSLDALFGHKVASLDTAAFDVVAVSALMRRPDVASLRRACPDEHIEAALHAAEIAGLLRVVAGRIEFDHALTRQAVIDRIGGIERLRLHARIASVSDDLEDRARHLGLSTLEPDASIAAELEAAGIDVNGRGDPTRAAELLMRAVELTPPSDLAATIRRMARTGDAAADAGDWETARRMLNLAAFDLEHVDAELAFEARRSYLIALDRLEGHDACEGAIARCLDVATDPVERGYLLRTLVRIHQYRDLRLAGRTAELAVAEALESHDPDVILDADAAAMSVRFLRGERVDLDAVLDRLARREVSSKGQVAESFVVELLVWDDRHDDARRLIEQIMERANELGRLSPLVNEIEQLVNVERRAGDWGAMRDAIARLRSVSTMVGNDAPHMALGDVVWIAGASGDDDRHLLASAIDSVGDDLGVWSVPLAGAIGFALLARGDHVAACEHLRRAHRWSREYGLDDMRAVGFQPDLVEALVLCGDIETAAEISAEVAGAAERAQSAVLRLEAARCEALVSSGRGDHRAAAAVLEARLASIDDVPRPFEIARSRLVLGAALRRAGARARAREMLSHARSEFERLGAAPWIARTDDEIRRLGSRGALTDDPTALSESEQQVAELLLDGLTNRQIATALMVSLRTVESHLTRIYRKAGVRSRAEYLARRSARPVAT